MKYMGSKARIAKYIVPILQKCIDDNVIYTYIEPFVGGGNVIDKIQCISKYGYDKNKYLIGLFKYLQDGGALLEAVSRELYSEVRSTYKTIQYADWYVGNIGFLASYNGRWFDGGYAQAGYDGARYRDYYQEAKRNIEAQVPYILDVVFETKDYVDLVPEAPAVIYCDPPYADTKQFANARDFDYNEFWNKMREWSKDNFVFISELTAPDDFECIWEKPVSRSIRSTNKGTATEKLFVYKDGRM